jgi:hypothetical protein
VEPEPDEPVTDGPVPPTAPVLVTVPVDAAAPPVPLIPLVPVEPLPEALPVELWTVGEPLPVSVAVVPVAAPPLVSPVWIVSVEPSVCSFGLPPHAASEATIAAMSSALAITFMSVSSLCEFGKQIQQGLRRTQLPLSWRGP